MNKEFSEKEIFDYAYCPIYHHVCWNNKMEVGDYESMPKLLNKVANFYFLRKMDGNPATENELKRKWDSICNEADITDPKKVLGGIDLVYRFNRWLSSENIKLIDFGTAYQTMIGGYLITGNTGIVVEQYNQLCLLVPDFSSRLPDQLQLDIKQKYTLDAYVFEKLHHKPVNGIRVHNVKNARDFYTQRSQFDFKRLETSIGNICSSIANDIVYPREGMCNSCLALDYCKGWCGK